MKETSSPTNSGDPSALITLATIVTKTKVKRASKKKRFSIVKPDEQATFELAINGGYPDVVLPQKLQYSDPLTSLSMKTEQFYDQKLADDISTMWRREGNDFCLQMARFRMVVCTSKKKSELKLKFNHGVVRIKEFRRKDDTAKCSNPLELQLWSHNARNEEVICSMIGEQGKRALDRTHSEIGNSELSDKTSQAFIDLHCKVENLPKSYNNPTMCLKFALLPKPNQIGIKENEKSTDLQGAGPVELKGSLMHDKVDQSHLICAKPGEGSPTKAMDKSIVQKLFEFHIGKKQSASSQVNS